jgi:hypothetical protein
MPPLLFFGQAESRMCTPDCEEPRVLEAPSLPAPSPDTFFAIAGLPIVDDLLRMQAVVESAGSRASSLPLQHAHMKRSKTVAQLFARHVKNIAFSQAGGRVPVR